MSVTSGSTGREYGSSISIGDYYEEDTHHPGKTGKAKTVKTDKSKAVKTDKTKAVKTDKKRRHKRKESYGIYIYKVLLRH